MGIIIIMRSNTVLTSSCSLNNQISIPRFLIGDLSPVSSRPEKYYDMFSIQYIIQYIIHMLSIMLCNIYVLNKILFICWPAPDTDTHRCCRGAPGPGPVPGCRLLADIRPFNGSADIALHLAVLK